MVVFFPRLYECLCDARSTNCSAPVTPPDDLFMFRDQYTVTSVSQRTMSDEVNTTKLYSASFHCNEWPMDDLHCRRMKSDDDICETKPDKCHTFRLQFNASICSLPCVTLVFVSDYITLDFINFGEIPVPVKEKSCLEDRVSTTVRADFDTTSAPNLNTLFQEHSIKPRDNATLEDGQVNSVVIEKDDANPRQTATTSRASRNNSLSLPTIIIIGTLVGGLLLITGSLIVYKYLKSREKAMANISTEIHPSGHTPEAEPDIALQETRTEGEELVGYFTLDEVSSYAEPETNFEELDDEGYNIVQNCATTADGAKDERRCRPLQQPPVSSSMEQNIEAKSHSMSMTKTATSSSTKVATRAANTLIVNPSSVLDPQPPKCHQRSAGSNKTPDNPQPHRLVRTTGPPDIPPHTPNPRPHRLVRTTGPPDIPPRIPLPRPHRRRVDLNQHQYVSLVNFRPDPHSPITLNHVTEAKLVRTKEGQLELISVDDELATFTEYYTRLLIINQGQGSLGIVGLLENDTTNSDRREHLDFSDERTGHKTNTSDLAVSSGGFQIIEQMTEDAIDFDRAYESFLYVYYIGSLDVGHNIDVSPCEYLTVLDTDASLLPFEDGGYLTVSDTDGMIETSSSHVELQSTEFSYN